MINKEQLNNTADNFISVVKVVNSIINVIDESKIVDKGAQDKVIVATNNLVAIIQNLANNIQDLNLVLQDLNQQASISELFTSIGDPISIIKAIKGEKIDKLTPFTFYINLLHIAKQISDLSDGIDRKSIKNSKRQLLILIESIKDVYQSLIKKLLFIRFADTNFFKQLVEQFTEVTNYVIRLLISNIETIHVLIKDSIDKKQVRKSIDSLFVIYHSLLWNAFKLGLFIKFFNPTNLLKNLAIAYILALYLNVLFKQLSIVIDQVIKLGSSYTNTRFGINAVKHIYIDILSIFRDLAISDPLYLLLAYAITIQLNNIFSLLTTTIENLAILGENYARIRLGIDAIGIMFTGGKMQNSLLYHFRQVKLTDVVQLTIITISATLLSYIFTLLGGVINQLKILGENYIYVRLGIHATKRIFGTGRNELVGILIRRADPKTYALLLRVIPTVSLLSLIMLGLSIAINTLILIGRNRRYIKRGIRTLSYVLSHIINIVVKFNSAADVKQMIEFTIKTALLSVALMPIVIMMSTLGMVALFALPAIASMIAMVSIVISALFLIRVVNNQKNIPDGLSRLSQIMLSLSAAVGIVAILSTITINLEQIALFTASYLMLVAAGAFSSLIIGRIKGLVVTGVLLILLMITNLYLTALIIQKISEIKISVGNVGNFVLAVLTIIGLAALLAISALYLPIAILGATMTFALVTILLLTSLEIQILAQIKLKDINNAKENVKVIFETCNTIIQEFIFNTIGTPKNGQANSWGKKLLMYVGGPIAQVIEAIFAVAYVTMIFIAITFILLIAVELRLLQELNLDQKKIIENVNDVIVTGQSIIDLLYSGGSSKEGYADAYDKLGIFGALINFACPPLVPILESIFAVLNVAMIFISVSFILLIAVELRLLQEINLDQGKIRENIDNVIGAGQMVTNAITTNRKSKETKEGQPWWRKALGALPLVGKMTDIVEAIMNIGSLATTFISIGLVTIIAKNLEYLGNLQLNSSDIRKNLTGPDGILTISNQLVTDIKDSKVESISEEKVKSFGLYVNDSVKLMKQINKLDTEKLVKYSDMWAKMTEFMQEIKNLNIEELSDAIVNKIAPAMSDISSNVDKMSGGTQTVSLAQPDPPTPPSNTANDPTANKVTNTPEPIDYTSILQGIKDAVEDILQQRMMG